MKCYLEAWTKAQRYVRCHNVTSHALHEAFIPNWTSKEFESFVEQLASVTDRWAEKVDKETRNRAEELWFKVLNLESLFWPDVKEDPR